MKKLLFLIIMLLSMLMLVGCMTPQQKSMYNWENYSSTLYNFKKDPSEENLKKHKETLLKIIEKSKEEELKVPPGVYCEYGYFLMKEGKNQEALTYFELEEKTYPESVVFVQKLKSQVNKTGGVNNEKR